jgi:probable F420-dependent oxidoreductase
VRFNFSVSAFEPDLFLPVAIAADEAGYDNILYGDSVFYPKESVAKHPYTEDGDRTFLSKAPFLEPFSIIPAMAAVTKRIGFIPFVLKLPLRHPIIVAKQVSSVAVITGNRLKIGVGTSPFPEEYDAVGVPWKGRGKRLEESIAVIRGLTSGGFFAFHGEHYSFDEVKMQPMPSKKVPILIGGHSKTNLDRATAIADGWAAAGASEKKLAEMVTYLRRQLVSNGRGDEPFEIHAGTRGGYSPERIKQLEDPGVTDLSVTLVRYRAQEPADKLQGMIDSLRRFADEVVHA